MPGPFDRSNDRAKRALALAQDEAIRFDHSYIGVEHLLLGLIREGEGVPARVLPHRIVATLGQRAAATPAGRPPATERLLLDAQGNKRDWYCEDVLSGKLNVSVLFEDERVLGIEHPFPTYQVHGVVIPKKHVPGLLAPEALDPELLTSMLRGVQAVAAALGIAAKGFRVEANAGAPGVTPHMHWHVVGPGLPPPQR